MNPIGSGNEGVGAWEGYRPVCTMHSRATPINYTTRLRREPRLGGAERAAALDREVGTLSCSHALGGGMPKEESGAEARCWRSQTSDPRRPALKALPNLSLNVSDTLRATRAE